MIKNMHYKLNVEQSKAKKNQDAHQKWNGSINCGAVAQFNTLQQNEQSQTTRMSLTNIKLNKNNQPQKSTFVSFQLYKSEEQTNLCD